MARPGRKRKDPMREERHADISPAKIRRSREAAMAMGADAVWGYPIGRLAMAKEIDDFEMAAAARFARDMDAWARATGQNPNPSAIDYNRIQGRGTEDAAADERAKRQWDALYGALRSVHVHAYAVARRACFEGQAVTLPDELDALKIALDRLAVFYGFRAKMRRAA